MSFGCYIGLWYFKEKDYYSWVYKEDLDYLMFFFCLIIMAMVVCFGEQEVMVGVGIYDSLVVLLFYIFVNKELFLLLLIGIWSIVFNVFSI